MIRLIAVVFALAVSTSAQAMSLAPLHQPDNMIAQVEPSMRRGYAQDQWKMRDHIRPPPRPPRMPSADADIRAISQSSRKGAAASSALICEAGSPGLGLARCRRLAIETASGWVWA